MRYEYEYYYLYQYTEKNCGPKNVNHSCIGQFLGLDIKDYEKVKDIKDFQKRVQEIVNISKDYHLFSNVLFIRFDCGPKKWLKLHKKGNKEFSFRNEIYHKSKLQELDGRQVDNIDSCEIIEEPYDLYGDY